MECLPRQIMYCTIKQISMYYKRLYRSLFLKEEIIIFKNRSDHYFLKVEISNFKISRKILNFFFFTMMELLFIYLFIIFFYL